VSLTTQANTPPSDGAVTAAGRVWKYIEAFWVRDRLGRWLKYIGPKDGSLWNTDPATGRETPNFPIIDAYEARTSRTPKYKARVASQKLDDGSVIFEVARNSNLLGRGADPTEKDYDTISRDLPDALDEGQTAFVRRDPKTVELTDDAAKMGGRARITRPTREGRATITPQPGVENVLEEEGVDPWQVGPEDFSPRTDEAVDLLSDPAATTDDFGPLALATPETRAELAQSLYGDDMFNAWLDDLRANDDFQYTDGQQAQAAQDFFETGLEDVRAYLDETLPPNPTVDDVEQGVQEYMRGEIPDFGEGYVPSVGGPIDSRQLEGVTTALDDALRNLYDNVGDGDVDQGEAAYLEDALDMVDQIPTDSDPDSALERLRDGLEYARSVATDPDVQDGLDQALLELGGATDRRARADTDPWGAAYSPFMPAPTDWPLEPEAWAGTQTSLPPGGYTLEAPPSWADRPGAVLKPGDQVDVEYDWDGNLADIVLPEGVTDLPEAEREALEEALGLRQSDLWALDGTATASTPASALPVWSEMFTPDKLAGWTGNDDDPAILYSEDGRWVLDADPDSVGAEDQVLLFDNQTGVEQRLPLDDPELDQILARPRAGIDAWEGGDAQIEETASILHENWRANRLLPDGTFDPRLKDDGQGGQVDIANTPYADLPEKWQAENRAAATAVVKAIRENPDADMEALADIVHQDWMARNGSWAPPEQMLPYAELSPENKDLDRDVVRAGLQTLGGEPSSSTTVSDTAKDLQEDLAWLNNQMDLDMYSYMPSPQFSEQEQEWVADTLGTVEQHLSFLATGEPSYEGYDPKKDTAATTDNFYNPPRPEGLTPEQDAVWSAMRLLADLETFTKDRGEDTIETDIQEPLRHMYQGLLKAVGDDRFDAAAVSGHMVPNNPVTGGPAEERAIAAQTSATAKNLLEDMSWLEDQMSLDMYSYLPSPEFSEQEQDWVGDALDIVKRHLNYIATGEKPYESYDPKTDTTTISDNFYSPTRPDGLTPQQDAAWSAMRILADLVTSTKDRDEDTIETDIQDPLRHMYQELLDAVEDPRLDNAAVEGHMVPLQPPTGPAEERELARAGTESPTDYLDNLENALEGVDPFELPPEVNEAMEAVDGVTDDDGSISDDATSSELDGAAESLDDADVSLGTIDTPAEENLSGALQDAADTLDVAADIRMVQEDEAGTRPERQPLSVMPNPINQYVNDEDVAKYDAAANNAVGRYTSAMMEYQAGMKRGDEAYAAERLNQMQQALSDLSAEMMESTDPEDQLAGRKMRAANRKLGTGLRKAQFPKTKIDRRQQPKARSRRAAAAANREERSRRAAIRRKVRGLQRSEDLGLTPEQQAAFDGLEPQAQLDLLTQHLENQTPLGQLVDTAVPPTEAVTPAGETPTPEGEASAGPTDEAIDAFFNQLAGNTGPNQGMNGYDEERRERANAIIYHLLDPENAAVREQFDALSPTQQYLAVAVPAQRTNADPIGAFDITLNRLTERAQERAARFSLDGILADLEQRASADEFGDGELQFNSDILDGTADVRAALGGQGDITEALEGLQNSLLRAVEHSNATDGVYDDAEVDLSNRLQQARLDRATASVAATPTSSTDSPNRATVVDAIGQSQASTTTQRRAETAVSTADIAESVNIDAGVNVQRRNLAAGEQTDPATSDAIAQANNVTEIGEPDGPPAVTAAEQANAAARAQFSRDLSALPLEAQTAEIFAVIDANPELRAKVDNYVYQPRPGGHDRDGNPRPPEPSRQAVLSQIQAAGDLTPRQRKQLGNILFFMNRHFTGLTYQGSPEMQGAAQHVADRIGVLLDSYLVEHDVTLHNYTVNQDTHGERMARLARIWEANAATIDPADTGWWYMDDYGDDADYSQEIGNLDTVLDTLGGEYTGPIDTFAIDPSPQAALVKARADLTSFIRMVTANNPDQRFQREETLERIINHLNRVGGSNYDTTVVGLRDDILSIRHRAHNHDNQQYGTPWDATDDVLSGIRDGLIQFQGSNRGRIVSNAKKAIDDALAAEAGSERRWSSLARARNELDVLHARELIPAMNALRVRVNEDRLRDLGDTSYDVSQDNVPPSRAAPRGAAWTTDELQSLNDIAGQLEQEASQYDAAGPQLQMKAAGLLKRAVRAYEQGKYGEFEQTVARAMSRLMEANDVGRLQTISNLRDTHWEPNDWATRADDLRSSIVQQLGYLPTDQQVAPQNGDLLDAQRNRQLGRALIAEGLARPAGSTQQRTHYAAALWFLNQADDPRDQTMRDLLRPWDPNGDILSPATSPINPNAGGSTVPPQAPGDARIARAQQAAAVLRSDGFVMRATLADQFGMTPAEVDNLFQTLVGGNVFGTVDVDRIGNQILPAADRMYFPGPLLQQSIDGRPMTGAEWDNVIQQTMAAAETVTTTVERQNPAEHPFNDPRITVNPDGTINVGDQITAAWNESTNAWGWTAAGRPGPDGQPVQDEIGSAQTLEELEAQLSTVATARQVPFPGTGEGAGEGEGVGTGTGEGVENPYAQHATTVAALAEKVTSTVGDTDTAAILDSVAQSLANGDAQTAVTDLERASASLLDNAAVLHSALTEDTGNYDPEQNLAVGEAYAGIRRAAAAIPQPVDMTEALANAQRVRGYATTEQEPMVDRFIEQMNGITDVASAEAVIATIRDIQNGNGTYDERRTAQRIGDIIGSAVSDANQVFRPVTGYRVRDANNALDSLSGIVTPEQQALVDQVRAMHATDPTGALNALRQVSLDMLENSDTLGLPREMTSALRFLDAEVSSRGGYYSRLQTPSGLGENDYADVYALVTRYNDSEYENNMEARYEAARALSERAAVAATNPSFTVQQRRDFATLTARTAAVMDTTGRKLAQINALRDPSGDVIRRPPGGTPGIPSVNGTSLLPGDVIRRNGNDYLYQSAVLDPDTGRFTASVVDLQSAESTTLRQETWNDLAESIVSGSPQAADPLRHWGRIGTEVTPERLQELTDQFGRETAARIQRMIHGDPRNGVGGAASVAQIFDADAPMATREQAVYDMLTSHNFSGIRTADLAVDLSTPDRLVVTGALEPTRAGTAPETFRWELSRNGELPAVSQVSFSDQPVAVARAASAQQFLRQAEDYTIGNGGASIQLANPSTSAKVSAANAGYDWDDHAMGGFEPTRNAVRSALQRVARNQATNPAIQAVVEQMFRDTDAATDVDGLPTPFEIANIDPNNPKIGQRAIAQTAWTPARFLTGPSRMVARKNMIEQRAREAAQRARQEGFAVWGDDRVPALLHALTRLPDPSNIGSGEQGRRRLGAVMNVVNDNTLQPGQPGLTLQVSHGNMSANHTGRVNFNVFEFVEPGKRNEVRRVGTTDIVVDHYEALAVLGAINEWQKAHDQKLPAFGELFGTNYGQITPGTLRVDTGQGGTRRATMDDLQREFNGDMKKFRNQVASTRQTWNLEAMSKLHDFHGAQLTHPQMLRANDAMWQGDAASADEVRQSFAEAGVSEAAITSILASAPPGQIATDLQQRLWGRGADALTPNLLQSGHGDFTFQGDSMYAGLMSLDPAVQGGGMATLLQGKFADWGVAHEVFKSVTVQANIDVGSFAWGLVGFGFKDTGEDRRSTARQMLGWLYASDPTDAERAKMDELKEQINTGDPSKESFPNPFDIISIGMIDGYVNGSRDWVGKRAMIGGGRSWYGRMMLKPDRLYQQARGLRQMQTAMRQATLVNQADGGVPGNAPSAPVEPVTPPGGISESDAETLLIDLGESVDLVPMVRRVFAQNPTHQDTFRGLPGEQQRAALQASQGRADDFRDMVSIFSGGQRAVTVPGTEAAFDQVYGEASPVGMGRLLRGERILAEADEGRLAGRFAALSPDAQIATLRSIANDGRDNPLPALNAAVEWAIPETTNADQALTTGMTQVAEQVVDARGGLDDAAARARAVEALSRFYLGRPDLGNRFAGLPQERQQTILREVGYGSDDPTSTFTSALQREYAADQTDLDTIVGDMYSNVRRANLRTPLRGGTSAGERDDNIRQIVRAAFDSELRGSLINQPWFDQDRFNTIVGNAATSTWRTSDAERDGLRELRAWRDQGAAGGAAPPTGEPDLSVPPPAGEVLPGGTAIMEQADAYLAGTSMPAVEADRVRAAADAVSRDQALLEAWNAMGQSERIAALGEIRGGVTTPDSLRRALGGVSGGETLPPPPEEIVLPEDTGIPSALEDQAVRRINEILPGTDIADMTSEEWGNMQEGMTRILADSDLSPRFDALPPEDRASVLWAASNGSPENVAQYIQTTEDMLGGSPGVVNLGVSTARQILEDAGGNSQAFRTRMSELTDGQRLWLEEAFDNAPTEFLQNFQNMSPGAQWGFLTALLNRASRMTPAQAVAEIAANNAGREQ
jgi:hypothetical protein